MQRLSPLIGFWRGFIRQTTRMTRTNSSRSNVAILEAGFICKHCDHAVAGGEPGTRHRNHCPHCLWSLHVDVLNGDRKSGCAGAMDPIAIWVRNDGEWALVHRCTGCGILRTNRIAGDDNALILMSIAVRPLARAPFPLDRLTCSCSVEVSS